MRTIKYLRHSRSANTRSSFKCSIIKLIALYLIVKTTKRAIKRTSARYIIYIKVDKKIGILIFNIIYPCLKKRI
jgi:hypothetical protein